MADYVGSFDSVFDDLAYSVVLKPGADLVVLALPLLQRVNSG